MKKNMGALDKIVRLLVALVAVIFYFNGTLTGVVGIVFMAIAIVFVVTSMLGFCPLYTIFGLSTCRKKDGK